MHLKAHRLRVLLIFLFFGMWWLLPSCNKGDRPEISSAKFKQYFVQGEKLYLQHCSNCHQKDGGGLGLLYPPIDTSDYMQNHLEDVVCLIRNGKNGELIVNGNSYNQAMPGNASLTDLEIAEITTYIFNSWSHQNGIVEVNTVSKIFSMCDSLNNN